MTNNQLSLAASLLSAAFLTLLITLHFLKPEIDPSWRLISEYAVGSYGQLMIGAFFCWGSSILTLLFALWNSLRGRSGVVVRIWFVIIGIALFGAGIFVTTPLTNIEMTFDHKMHQVCGTIVIFTFPIAATILTSNLRKNEAWKALDDQLRRLKLLPWIGLLAFFSAIIIFRLLNPQAGRVGPHMQVGWVNRFMVLTYHGWIQFMAAYVRQIENKPT